MIPEREASATLTDGSGDGAGAAPGADHTAAARTYETAVQEGFYKRDRSGLYGKYDNVRRYWEDQVTRYSLHASIEPLVCQKRRELSRIRVLDLGAGAGEGYEILTSLKKRAENLASREVDVLPSDILGYYKGLDVSEAMVEQGNRIYAGDPKVEFVSGDLTDGLAEISADGAYDIYFSSYGSLSHLSDEEFARLVTDICEHMDGSCVFVADLIGRYSYEWQRYWKQAKDETNMRQYSMSYLYPGEMLDHVEVERFPLRYWGATEFDEFMTRVIGETGAGVRKRQLWDRSILVGRHMNTGEFNEHATPIRDTVNSLHEFDRRTELHDLLFDYTPHSDFPDLNAFFEGFQMAWNAVVYAAIEALERWNETEWLKQPPQKDYPEPVREAIKTIRDVIRNVKWFRMGDPRANVVEPQLGYILRNLEMDLQQGLGAAHSLLAVYELSMEKLPAP